MSGKIGQGWIEGETRFGALMLLAGTAWRPLIAGCAIVGLVGLVLWIRGGSRFAAFLLFACGAQILALM